jgi:hypothetical protein
MINPNNNSTIAFSQDKKEEPTINPLAKQECKAFRDVWRLKKSNEAITEFNVHSMINY